MTQTSGLTISSHCNSRRVLQISAASDSPSRYKETAAEQRKGLTGLEGGLAAMNRLAPPAVPALLRPADPALEPGRPALHNTVL